MNLDTVLKDKTIALSTANVVISIASLGYLINRINKLEDRCSKLEYDMDQSNRKNMNFPAAKLNDMHSKIERFEYSQNQLIDRFIKPSYMKINEVGRTLAIFGIGPDVEYSDKTLHNVGDILPTTHHNNQNNKKIYIKDNIAEDEYLKIIS